MKDLERRIAAALSHDTTSDALDLLLNEVEEAIIEAEANAKAEREKALDLTKSPDAKAAREAVMAAEFTRDRLRKALPRLQRRYEQVLAGEYLEAWRADYAALEPERDALADELREVYPAVIAQLADLMARLDRFDTKLSDLHQRRPVGEKLHLRGPELVARDLQDFSRSVPPLRQNLQLPDFQHSDRLRYPPPQHLDVSSIAPVPYDPRYSADWAEVEEERLAAIRAEHERVAAYNEERARLHHEREQTGS